MAEIDQIQNFIFTLNKTLIKSLNIQTFILKDGHKPG